MESPRSALQKLSENIQSVFFGHRRAVQYTLTTLLARGHLLIEDAPGVGKTLLARAVAQSLDLEFRRIQFTPDLLPSDITGVSIYNPTERNFEFVPGPVFTNVLLADEINRTSPRTQSSLLETMGESQVSVDGATHTLADLFFVMATQNPIELQGTYPLPEAQLDRFLMCIELGYPDETSEVRILESHQLAEPIDGLEPVMTGDELRHCQEDASRTVVSPEIRRYIVQIAQATRRHPRVRLGLSPRGSLALMKAAQAWAFLEGSSFVRPDDVKAVAPAVSGHRLVFDLQQPFHGAEIRALVEDVLQEVSVPATPQSVPSESCDRD